MCVYSELSPTELNTTYSQVKTYRILAFIWNQLMKLQNSVEWKQIFAMEKVCETVGIAVCE